MTMTIVVPLTKSSHNWSRKEQACFRLSVVDHVLKGSARLENDVSHQTQIGGARDCIGRGDKNADRIAKLILEWNGKRVPSYVEREILNLAN